MPELEHRPPLEEKAEDGRGDNEVGEEIPALSDFNSDRNIVQWRQDNLFPLLHAPEIRFSASSEIMLNGSQAFQQVYGSGAEALAFQSRVVTNVTQYHHNGSQENLCEAENGGCQAADADASRSGPEAVVLKTTGGDTPLPSSASGMTQGGQSQEQSHGASTADDSTASSHSRGAEGNLREPCPVQRSTLLPSLDPQQRSGSAGHASGSQIHSEQQTMALAAQEELMEEESGDVFTDGGEARGGESGDVFTDGDEPRGGESGDVFTDGDEARGGESGEFVLRPLSKPSYVPLVRPIPCRRHVSVEILKIC